MRRARHNGFLMVLAALLAFPLTCAAAEPLDGRWAFDVDATLALMLAAGELPVPEEAVREKLARMRIEINSLRKTFIVTDGGRQKVNTGIVTIASQGGLITITRKEGSGEQYRFLPDGRLQGLENCVPAFVLRREE